MTVLPADRRRLPIIRRDSPSRRRPARRDRGLVRHHAPRGVHYEAHLDGLGPPIVRSTTKGHAVPDGRIVVVGRIRRMQEQIIPTNALGVERRRVGPHEAVPAVIVCGGRTVQATRGKRATQPAREVHNGPCHPRVRVERDLLLGIARNEFRRLRRQPGHERRTMIDRSDGRAGGRDLIHLLRSRRLRRAPSSLGHLHDFMRGRSLQRP
mmetsp:Transcript_19/g.48  ORF Transcript_19/g.48 Transcript_19/m.48 type:complete len:209 (+) Transcript_19:201-827(+)